MRYYNGNFIREGDNNPTTNLAIGLFDLEAQAIHKAETRWPSLIDPTVDFVEFSNRHIDSAAYMGNSNDYDGNYDVADIGIKDSFSGSARIYIGHKNSIPTGSTYRADCAVACIQILNSAGNTLLKSWNWSGNTSQGWENRSPAGESSGSITQGFPETLSSAAAGSYASNDNFTDINKLKWALSSSTGSSSTGAADGISSDYSENGVDSGIGTILPSPGNAVVAQVTDTYYIYRETSSSTRFSGVVARSPAYNFSGGEIIRIAHCMPGGSGSGNEMNPDDTLYIGIA